MSHGSGAVAERRAAIDVTNRRARIAIAAVAVECVVGTDLLRWSALPPIVQSAVYAAIGLLAAVLYCRWLYRAYEDNRRLAGRPLKLRPGQAVASFFIPLINIYRPYRAVLDLYQASDPRALPDPPHYRSAPSEVGYRSNALEQVVPPVWNKWCSVGLWWTTYAILPIALMPAAWALREQPSVTEVLNGIARAVSGVLAILVIRSIRARQNERLRRLEIAGESVGRAAVAGVDAPPVRVSPADTVDDTDTNEEGEAADRLRQDTPSGR